MIKLFLLILYTSLFAQFSVMSYNIRGYIPCDEFKTPSEHFYYRQNLIIDIIKQSNPDIIGLQEIFNIPKKITIKCNKKTYTRGYNYDNLVQKDIKELKQEGIKIDPPKHLIRDFIREKLKLLNYQSFYEKGGSPKIIFYKKNKFVFIDGGQFYHNKKYKKITTYVILKYKNTPILFVNTHLISGKKYKNVRKKSIKFIINKIKKINKNDYPIVLMGDFNIKFYSKEYIDLITQLFKIGLQNVSITNKSTYNGFSNKKDKIDYIFSKGLDIKNIEVINKVYDINSKKFIEFNNSIKNIIFPSDHWPIKIIFELKE